MPRTYEDACGIARALDVLGERWSLMIVRELLLGPKRFTDLRTGLPRVGPDMLAQRLRDLEQHGVVRQRTLPPPAASHVYELTPAGEALEPVLMELGRWGGANAPPPSEGVCMSLDSHLLSLRSLFVAERAGELEAEVELRLEGQAFHARIADGDVEVDRGPAAHPQATITTAPGTMIAVLHGHRPLDDVLASGELTIEGDEALARRFTTLFPLPEPAPAAAA